MHPLSSTGGRERKILSPPYLRVGRDYIVPQLLPFTKGQGRMEREERAKGIKKPAPVEDTGGKIGWNEVRTHKDSSQNK
jgi:hypothetical protein